MKSRLDILLAYLKDPNTVKMLITLAGLAGVAIDPEMITKIILGIIAARDLANMLNKDRLTNPVPPAATEIKE
jgi:hypothetical protein